MIPDEHKLSENDNLKPLNNKRRNNIVIDENNRLKWQIEDKENIDYDIDWYIGNKVREKKLDRELTTDELLAYHTFIVIATKEITKDFCNNRSRRLEKKHKKKYKN